jgi:hypothetical protein
VVEFAPVSHGPKSAALQIASNDPSENTLDVPLSGTGLDPLTGVPAGYPEAPSVVLHAPGPNPTVGPGGPTLRFELDRPATVTFRVYDVAGRLVAERRAQRFDAAGSHVTTWNPGPLTPGTYYLRLETNSGESATTSWVVLR